ncbi:hypothetical protein L0Y59_03075, partial [Candidatus Uhrbacteria bacterium]|nr:hypothetical protein [Candidatus Uhrbacteria bacterium]
MNLAMTDAVTQTLSPPARLSHGEGDGIGGGTRFGAHSSTTRGATGISPVDERHANIADWTTAP